MMEPDYKKELRRLLNKVNRVTCPFLHGLNVPVKALSALCGRQVEIEAAIAEQDSEADVTYDEKRFIHHLNEASKVVESWPKEKRDLLTRILVSFTT